MLTRCPACQTTFRLHPEQLRARHGEVRCGHCLSAFNALEHLFEDPQALAKPAQQTPPAPPDELAAAGSRTEAPLSPLSSEHSSIESFDFDLSDEPRRGNSRRQSDGHWPPAATRGARDEPTHDASPYGALARTPSLDPPARFPASARGDEAPPTETPDTTSGSAFPPATRLPPWPQPAEFDPVIVPDDDELERLDATYGAAPSRGRRIAWGLAVMLLTCTLAIQALYLFRQEITRELPGLRPLLVNACAQVGCTLPLPRDAGLIDIPTSDLQSEPGKAGRYVLYATVRNRAGYPQTWPHLELTLTDTSDTPIARRVLDPQDWVAPEKLAVGFPPRGDTAVRLAFDAPDLTPTSYRIYVFYP